MSRLTRTKATRIAAYVYAELREFGAKIEGVADTTPSIYIRFKERYLGKLRISDHLPNREVRYKWNIILEGEDQIVGTLHFATEHTYKPFVAHMKTEFNLQKNLRENKKFNHAP